MIEAGQRLMGDGKACQPSIFLRMVQRLYRSTGLRRGTGKLDWIPVFLLGGPVVWSNTLYGDLAVLSRDHGARQLLLLGRYDYEMDESSIVNHLLREASGMLDIGASFGWYTRIASKAMPLDSVRIAIEANPKVFACLEQSFHNSPGTIVRHAAATHEQRTVRFYCADQSNLSSAVRNVGNLIEVDGLSADQIWNFRDQLDFIKVDVEGGELDVLRGARNLRTRFRPIWMLEFDERMLREADISPFDVAAEVEEMNCCWRSLEGWTIADRLADVVGKRRVNQNVFLIPSSRMEYFERALHDSQVLVGPHRVL